MSNNFIDLVAIAEKEIQNDGGIFTKDTIIKEILHNDILRSLENSYVSDELVFQGGTALRLCYGSDRYSEDLDFVVRDPSKKFNLPLFKEFEKVFLDLMKKKYNLDAKVAFPKDDDNSVKRWKAQVYLPNKNKSQSQSAKINIEVCKIPSYEHTPIEVTNYHRETQEPVVTIITEDLEEIFADKILAFAGRDYYRSDGSLILKYRDLWDIKWLSDKNVAIRLDLIENKINDYQIKNFDKRIVERLAILQLDKSENFLSEMRRFLKPEKIEKVIRYDYFSAIKKIVSKHCNYIVTSLDDGYKIKNFDELVKEEIKNKEKTLKANKSVNIFENNNGKKM